MPIGKFVHFNTLVNLNFLCGKKVWSLLLLLVLLTGCGSNKVAEDLLNYVNHELPAVAALEGEAIGAYESVTGNNYSDDQTMYDQLIKVVIPKYGELVDKLEAIQPQTEELRKVHETYLAAANIQYNAFIQIQDAFEKQDLSLITQANEKLAQGRKGMRDFQAQLKQLAEENGVELTPTP